MAENEKATRELHEKYIHGTAPDAIVEDKKVLIGTVSQSAMKGAKLSVERVHLSTKALKHIYDIRTAEHYDAIVDNLYDFIAYPDAVYKSKPGKRATHTFVKRVGKYRYFCALELIKENHDTWFEFVTSSRFRSGNYLKGYKLLWSWEDD